jgi:UDP-MurNAc hydroxylase
LATLEFLGHAGFVVRHAGVSLVCDPWLSESGAFLRSWHQFPPNDFIDPRSLHDADFLYLSHRHFDHFDRDLLAAFPKEKVTVVIAEYLTDSFAREVAALGFPRIVPLPDWREHALAEGLTIRLWRDQTLYKLDSIALITAGGATILNKNDCHLAKPDFARFREGRVDLLLAQFSGAMWYPAAYVYPEIRETRITSGIRAALLDMFVDVADGVGARHVVHCAGPPCFLDEDSFRLNFSENGIFHDQGEAFDEIARRIRGRLHLVVPGDTLSIAPGGTVRRAARARPFDFARKEEALRAMQARRLPATRAFLASLPPLEAGGLARFEAFLRGLFASNRCVRERIDALVRFTVTGENGGALFVDTRGGRFSVSSAPPPGRAPASSAAPARGSYEFVIDSAIARRLADREELWEDVFLSMRFRARRDPDFYNWPLFAILQYGHDPALIGHVEEILRKGERDTIVVEDGAERYRIQRYCPHAGEDLTNAPIVDGKVICPRHQWAFDLRCGGACDRGGNVALSVRALGGAAPDPIAVERA